MKNQMVKYILRTEYMGYLFYDVSRDKVHVIKNEGRENQNLLEDVLPRIVSILQINKESITVEEIKFIDFQSVQSNKLSYPTTLFLEITQKCNLMCKHCFNKSGANRMTDMTLETLENLANEMEAHGIFNLKISGGEPFCREDIIEVLECINSRGINYILYSNGINISDKHIADLRKQKMLKIIRISIDGMPETNDQIRGKGSFDKAISTIKRLNANQIPCEINYTITSKNYKQIQNLENYLKTENISVRINIGMAKYSGRVIDNGSSYFVEGWMTEKISNAVKNQLRDSERINKFELVPKFYLELFSSSFGCPAGRITSTIKSNGDVFACGLFVDHDELLCGNITQTRFFDIWNGSEMDTLRHLVVPDKCNECANFREKCTGACRGNALNYYHDLRGEDINCSIYGVDFNNHKPWV